MRPILPTALLLASAALAAPQWKPVLRETPTAGAAVIAPVAEPTYTALGKRLADALVAELVDERDALDNSGDLRDDLQQRHTLLLGKSTNNRALFRLYVRELCACDNQYPGPGGWVIRSVCDPWGTGANAVVVGASDAMGAKRAVEALIEMVTEGGDGAVLPWALKLRSAVSPRSGGRLFAPRTYDAKAMAAFRKGITYTNQPLQFFPSKVLTEANRAAERYWRVGGSEAELEKWRLCVSELRKLGSKIVEMRAMEFRLKDFVTAWERLEAMPAITDSERADVVALLWSFGHIFKDEYWHGKGKQRVGNLRVTTNHVSNGTLGYLRLGRYFQRRCKLSASEAKLAAPWVEDADVLFNGQEQSYKSGCDANGYQWWTMKHMLMYALRRPDLEFAWNGNLRKLVNLIFVTMDNRGHPAQFGDVGGKLTGYSGNAGYLLPYAAQLYDDGRSLWIAHYCNRIEDAALAGLAEPIEPVDLVGTAVAPWSRSIYIDKARRSKEAAEVPWHSTFDKISFRNSFERDDAYLILDGIGGMGHGQDDCNAITRFAAQGKIWLIDCEYDKKTMFDHNGVFVSRNGEAGALAYTARLDAFADLATVRMTRTSTSDPKGLTWARHLFWMGVGRFICIDTLRCNKAGDYQANCIWRCRAPGRLDGRVWRSRQADAELTIVSDGAARAKTAREGRDHFRGVKAYVLRQVVSRRMERGDRLAYANFLEAGKASADDTPAPERLTRNAWRIRDGLVAVEPLSARGIETDAVMTFITRDSIALVRATHCAMAGETLVSCRQPTSIELTRAGCGVLLAGEPTEITLPVLLGLTVDGEAPQSADGQLLLPRGRRVLRYRASTELTKALDRAEALVRDWPTSSADQIVDHRLPRSTGRMLWVYRGVRGPMNPLTPAKATCPQAHYGRWGPVDRLVDGQWSSSTASVMWDAGIAPVITVDMGRGIDLDQIVVRTWEALGSSESYKLGKVEVHASDTGEERSFRKVLDDLPCVGIESISGKNRNGIREAGGLGRRTRHVRLVVHPAGKEKRVYLAEVLLYESAEKGGEPGRVMDVAAADLDDDGRQEVVVAGSDGAAHCLRSDGTPAWKFETGGGVNAVWAGKLDGQPAVLAGSEDAHVYRLDGAGKEVWRRRTYHYSGGSGQDGGVCRIAVAQLDPAQPRCIIVGADNWHLTLLTTAGKEIRHTYYYAHETSCLRVADLDGDGRQEVVNCNSFAGGSVFDHEARKAQRLSGRVGPGVDVAVGDLDGDGKREIVLAGQSGIAAFERTGSRRWRHDTRCPQTCVVAIDLDGDGKDEVVTGGKNGFLIALRGDGTRQWFANAGDSVNALVVATIGGERRLLAASDDGTVQAWTFAGECVVRYAGARGPSMKDSPRSAVSRVWLADLDGDGEEELLTSSVDGAVRAVGMR